jgi:glyoxylase-like metal-dependent hydrolase (beta-lactamase superfamily II)
MNTIKILIQGYAKSFKDYELASSTTVLIKIGKLNIIVDPGMNKDLLLKALKKEKLKPEKVNYVILTHYHLDHSLLTGIFNNAQVLDDTSIYSFNGKIGNHKGKVPGTNIRLIKTPGHDPFHCSVLVETQKSGNIVIAGDVFWWPDSEKQKIDLKSLINLKDPYMKDKKQLIESRKKLLEIADYIIPGHGKMFKVEK